MIHWIPLVSAEQIDELIELSHGTPCVIYKHSTSCSISHLVKHRLEQFWDLDTDSANIYYLDLLRYRHLSNYVEETFEVVHESPQVLLIVDGRCIYHTSHLDISVEDIKSHLKARQGA